MQGRLQAASSGSALQVAAPLAEPAPVYHHHTSSAQLPRCRLLIPSAVAKPKSSRNSSIEAFVVCRRYSPPPGFEPAQLRALLQGAWQAYGPEAQHRWAAAGQPLLCAQQAPPLGGCEASRLPAAHGVRSPASLPRPLRPAPSPSSCPAPRSPLMRQLVPFLACGDLDGWDADQSYDLPAQGYVSLPPVQPPTAPAYRRAVEQLRGAPPGGVGGGSRGGQAPAEAAAAAAATEAAEQATELLLAQQ